MRSGSPPLDASDEVAALIEVLHESSRRLEELTAGEVDSVVDRDGRFFLLRHAQAELRNSEAAKQALILNALPSPLALLDVEGVLVAVNKAWRESPGVDALQAPGHPVGSCYLGICQGADGDNAAAAREVARGIRSVLDDGLASFEIEYGCRSETDQLWFLMRVSPLAHAGRNGAVVMHLDITEQKRSSAERKAMEDSLFAEKERAEVTLNSIGDAVICTDVADNVTFLNRMGEWLTGWSWREAAGKPLSEVVQFLDVAGHRLIQNLMAPAGEQGHAAIRPQGTQSILIRRDGLEVPIEISAAAIRDRAGEASGAVIVLRDVSAAHAMAAQMTHTAEHDYLTGLPNRMLLNDRIGQAIALAERHQKRVALLFLDVDGFKHINDSLGHPIGDKLLQSIANRLVHCVRQSDTVSRQGGDEFVVLLSEVEEMEDAVNTAQRLLQVVAEGHAIDQDHLHVTTSIGVSIYPDDGLDAETLIKNADTAMYQAKEKGRQGYQFFTKAMNVRAVERQSIEEDLRRALEREQFTLHYQPKLDLATGAITGAEALIRWTHPTRGQVPPGQFISIAEDCGLIAPIGAWVLREACRQARVWTSSGLPFASMAVNVSARQFRADDFLGSVLDTLSETGLDPSALEVELTESVLMQGADSAAAILHSLRDSGVQVAIDDFGTGYSSLSYLRKFPVDALKVDQSFVRQISTPGEDTRLVAAVIAIAQSLKLRVVAEGVETLDELQFLRAHRCDEAQGYYFSRPVPADQFARLLEAGIPRAAPEAPERDGAQASGNVVRLPGLAPSRPAVAIA